MFSKVAKVMACFGSTALIMSSQNVQAKELVACHDCHMKRLPKARELPIYDKKDEDYICEYDGKSTLPLISEISVARKKVFEYGSYVNMIQEQAVHMYETGVAHSKGTFDYLKTEENKVQRVLVIAFGGLVGLSFARKRGIFKKIFYTSLGTGAIFYVFYPSISKEYALAGWKISKDQINTLLTKYGGYNTDKIAEDANERIEYVKSLMKFESAMKILNEKFYKKDKELKDSKSGDAADNNKDMYTTRASV